MGKLLVVLLLGLYLTFQLAGNDPSQLRPGLVNAGVDPAALVIVQPVETRELAAVRNPAVPKATSSEGSFLAPRKTTAPKAEVLEVTFSPETAPTALKPQPDKVFTLSALPGQSNAPTEPLSETPLKADAPAPEVWYVTGRAVNVRLDPSTDAPVVGKLSRGDAALVLADNGAGWAMVSVEGDGVTGYVSMDFLSPTAP